MTMRIMDVRRFKQHGVYLYSFVLKAQDVVDMCRVERFGVDPEGVNRRLDEGHALEISEKMLDHSSLWLEPILGDLSGDGWTYDEASGVLTAPTNGFISIDDGQHRWHALTVLNALERDHLEFNVTVTMNLPFERRLAIFRMQSRRKKIDARLDLAQRHRIGDWKSPVQQEAYELVLLLNSDTTSPLRGMILLDEQEKRPHEGRHRPVGVNANGLVASLRSVIGGKSPLSVLSAEQRQSVVLSLVRLAADIWRKEWRSDEHVLTTARGINAILMLVVSSPNFRGAIGDDFSQESLKRGLLCARTFSWTSSKLKNASIRDIVARLDQAIGRNNNRIAA